MNEPYAQRVIVTGLDIPFGDLVVLLIKIALASIPAAVLLAAVGFVVGGFVAALIGA